MTKNNLAEIIKQRALELGFSKCGISPVMDSSADLGHLRTWISEEKHGEMQWMERSIPLRENPALLLPEIKSVVVLALNYFTDNGQSEGIYKISKYAQHKDYHNVLKSKIFQLLETLKSIDITIEGRAFVDSGPVFEKSYAVNAGLGWIGKNSCFILPKQGSFFFLGVLLLNKNMDYGTPFSDNYCGSCTRCIDACPTHAIVAPQSIDARKCISYLTIELHNKIPTEIDFTSTNQIFGCDLCQEVCPHNKFSTHCLNNDFEITDSLRLMDNDSWQKITKSEFKKRFKQSPILRAGYEKIKSNIDYINKKNHEPNL